MTPKETLQRKEKPLSRPKAGDRLYGIMGTARLKTTSPPQDRGKEILIGFYSEYQELSSHNGPSIPRLLKK